MIIIYHNNYTISEIVSTNDGNLPIDINLNIVETLFYFAETYKDEILVWCNFKEKENLNVTEIPILFHHNKLLLSYNPSSYFDRFLGYIEDSPYITINKEVLYGTWQMSSHVGAIHASVINASKKNLKVESNFDYFLNSFAKRVMNHGVFCYSTPELLKTRNHTKEVNKINIYQFFKFTRQHYRIRWIFLLFLNLMLFEKKIALLPFLFSLFYKKRNFKPELLNKIAIKSNKKLIENGTIDVLIPTIGRKDYLLNVLNNLVNQTHLPNNVIIIEQNPEQNSQSELHYIKNQKWPFIIKHHFTNQAGACNARNIGLSLIESEFCFLADDDIVFENDLLEKAIQTFEATGNEAFLIACHMKDQVITPNVPIQFPVFGAGHALAKSSCIKNLRFNMGFEFGFGEDADFGMQLRNKGFDILYISTTTILHLKAPIGGFRSKPVLKWQHDIIQPKPSPTVMLYRLMYDTKEQISNYKSMVFIKNLNINFVLNPFKYIKTFKLKWNRSVYWANQIIKQ